mmetsp:Transcript_100935/g.200510  ORF Transcript_100935/g.200510 Transcript_100935/m.200510 type:complete len:207 (+) Transcript_100935:462-1082(+)
MSSSSGMSESISSVSQEGGAGSGASLSSSSAKVTTGCGIDTGGANTGDAAVTAAPAVAAGLKTCCDTEPSSAHSDMCRNASTGSGGIGPGPGRPGSMGLGRSGSFLCGVRAVSFSFREFSSTCIFSRFFSVVLRSLIFAKTIFIWSVRPCNSFLRRSSTSSSFLFFSDSTPDSSCIFCGFGRSASAAGGAALPPSGTATGAIPQPS